MDILVRRGGFTSHIKFLSFDAELWAAQHMELSALEKHFFVQTEFVNELVEVFEKAGFVVDDH